MSEGSSDHCSSSKWFRSLQTWQGLSSETGPGRGLCTHSDTHVIQAESWRKGCRQMEIYRQVHYSPSVEFTPPVSFCSCSYISRYIVNDMNDTRPHWQQARDDTRFTRTRCSKWLIGTQVISWNQTRPELWPYSRGQVTPVIVCLCSLPFQTTWKSQLFFQAGRINGLLCSPRRVRLVNDRNQSN